MTSIIGKQGITPRNSLLCPKYIVFLAHSEFDGLKLSRKFVYPKILVSRDMSERIPAKVKETVVEEVDRVKHLTHDAARSGAYLYPIKVCLRQQNWLIPWALFSLHLF